MVTLFDQIRLAFLKNPWWKVGEGLVIAVSGGVDSMTLLEAIIRLSKEFPARITCAHVNYHLRGEESDGQADLVRKVCAEKKIHFELANSPLFVIARSEATKQSSSPLANLQEEAREIRRRFFCETAKKVCGNKIFLAHHRDDQVETILLQMLRGTSVSGLSGMQACTTDSEGMQWIRPLLEYSKKELQTWGEQNSVPYLEDSSNGHEDYLRNKVRHTLVPLLHELQPAASEQILHLGRQAQTLKTHLEERAEAVFRRWCLCDNGGLIFPRRILLRLPEMERRALLRMAYAHFVDGAKALKRDHFVRMDCILQADEPRSEYQLPKGIAVRRRFEELIFEKAIPAGVAMDSPL